MGANFYIFGILVVLVLTCLAGWLYIDKHKDEMFNNLVDKICYNQARSRGFVRPWDEDDKRAILYAEKHNKKQPWIVVDRRRED